MIDPSTPPSLRDAVSRELERDEKVVWSAMPVPRCFTGPAARKFSLGVLLTVFSVSWMADGTGFEMPQFNQAQDLIPWIGFLLFFIIGIALLFAPLSAFRKSLKTVYVITDRRAITIEDGWSTTTRSYPPEKLTEVFRKERKDGTGDIVLARHTLKESEGERRVEELGFLRISDAKSAEVKLKELAEQRDAAESRNPACCDHAKRLARPREHGRSAPEDMIDPSMPPSLQEAIAGELECDETVVWIAMPKPRYFVEPAAGVFRSGIGLTVCSVFFMAAPFGIFPEFNSLRLFFLVGGLVFFSWGIAMMSSPLWAFQRSLKTAYAITDRRAITIVGGLLTTIRSYRPEKLTEISRKGHKDGTEDVTISHHAWRDPEVEWRIEELGFLRIRDAESVEAKLKELAEQSDSPEPRNVV